MKQLPGPNDNVLVYRSDLGWFWRLIGWGMLGMGLLAAIGSMLPPAPQPASPSAPTQPAASPPPATAQPEVAAGLEPVIAATADNASRLPAEGTSTVPEGPAGPAVGTPAEPEGAPVMAIVLIFALAGWALYRKRIMIDRAAGTITIRRGVGILGWTRYYDISAYESIRVDRRETKAQKSGPKVRYSVILSGPRGSLTLHEFVLDRLFDSSSEAARLQGTVAAFCGYNHGPAAPATQMEELERLERESTGS
jgi:hypothetical protein